MTVPPLRVEVDGRVLRFDTPRLIRIGRSIEADVVLSAGSVSRQHAELRAIEDGWILVDTRSQYGTYVDGRRIAELRITEPVTIQCGPEQIARIVVTPEVTAPAAVPAGFEQTRVIAGPGISAGGVPGPRSGPDLLVVIEGREYRYRHPAQVTIGRQPDCAIVVADPACSRMHGQVSAVPGGWVFTNTSREGSFVDGRRTEHTGFDERLALRLGHPVAGPKLMLVPILSAAEEERRFARKRRRRVLLVVGAVVAALALVAGTVTLAVVLSDHGSTPVARDDGSSASRAPAGSSLELLTQDELETAKAATVLLQGKAPDTLHGGTVEYSGSGSILTPDGLILTNAHVVRPTADGLAEYYGDDGVGDPDYLLVALVDSMDDSPAEASYRARPVEVDGHRDVAVVKIYADADGNAIDPADLDLPTMPLGDSDAMQSGDDVTILGFPGISESSRLSVTKGVISTFIDRPDLGPRSEIDTDARIAPGNSGGAAINNDAQIIGIPSALFGSRGSNVVSGRIRPINFVKDLIQDAEQKD